MKEYLNQIEAQEYLGVSRKTLIKFVQLGLPRYEYGSRRQFYKKSDIDDFLRRFRVEHKEK